MSRLKNIFCYHSRIMLINIVDIKHFLIFMKAITSSRSAYAELCDCLKKFSVDCGAERAAVIAKDFRFLYHRKPAFMNELTKAGF